jgi:Na+/phosphate symporter
MDGQFIWNAILTIGMALIGGSITLGARYLSQIKTSLQERLDALDAAIERLRDDYREDVCTMESKVTNVQEDFGRFKVLVYKDFVNREEYVRTTQGLDAKIDRVLEEVGKINVNVARLAATQEVKK